MLRGAACLVTGKNLLVCWALSGCSGSASPLQVDGAHPGGPQRRMRSLDSSERPTSLKVSVTWLEAAFCVALQDLLLAQADCAQYQTGCPGLARLANQMKGWYVMMCHYVTYIDIRDSKMKKKAARSWKLEQHMISTEHLVDMERMLEQQIQTLQQIFQEPTEAQS